MSPGDTRPLWFHKALALGRAVAESASRPGRELAELYDAGDYPQSELAYIRDAFELDDAETAIFALCLWRAAMLEPFPDGPALAGAALKLEREPGRAFSLLLRPDAGCLLRAACDIVFSREPRLPAYLRPAAPKDGPLYHDPCLLEQMERFLAACETERELRPAVLALTGPPGSGKKHLLAELAGRRGCSLLVADTRAMETGSLPELAGLALLTGSLICLDRYRPEAAPLAAGLFRWFDMLLLSGREAPGTLPGCGSMLERSLEEPGLARRLAAMEDALGDLLPQEELSHAAALCRASFGGILSAAARARAERAAGTPLSCKGLIRSLNSERATALSQNAQIFATNKSLDDLSLTATARRQLQNLCAFARQRETVWKDWGFESKIPYGRGITALFYGASGTGKTLAASAVANSLGLELYRVDLSQLISKYIGETQKNIGRVFDDSKDAECILFFDEADALFSRRGEVNDANDRYANAEIAYLLQRTEQHDGMILMATNLLQNFDEAFKRRIGFMIHFPMPDEAMREELWRGIFPGAAPLEEIDYPLLAKQLELSGASIRACALGAARLAAAEGGPVSMGRIAAAARDEYQKLGKSFPVSLAMMFPQGKESAL